MQVRKPLLHYTATRVEECRCFPRLTLFQLRFALFLARDGRNCQLLPRTAMLFFIPFVRWLSINFIHSDLLHPRLTPSLPTVLLSTVLRNFKFSFGREGVPRYLWATRLWGGSRIGNNCRTNAKVYEKPITVAKGLRLPTK